MNKRRTQEQPSRNNFLARVQEHEREWGTESYSQKPSLSDILSSKVVVFWQQTDSKDKRELISLHDDTQNLETFLARLVVLSNANTPDRKYVAAYENHKRLKIKGFKIVFEVIEDE